jgi:hypothetical protein
VSAFCNSPALLSPCFFNKFRIPGQDSGNSMLSKQESRNGARWSLDIAGHVAKTMREHYSRIRMAAKRNDLDALSMEPGSIGDSGRKGEGYSTNNVADLRREMEDALHVVECMVELSGIEPLASSLRTRRSPS